MTKDQALEAVLERVAPMPAEWIALDEASRRVLASDVLAAADMPAFHRSAMDGYLLRADAVTPGWFDVFGEILPGQASRLPADGTAFKVFTGSAVPENSLVVMREDTRGENDRVHVMIPADARHVRLRGSHARAGSVLMKAGSTIHAGAIAVLAANGMSRVPVARVPAFGHIATGGELVAPGTPLAPGQIHDSNSPMIAAMIAEHGGRLQFHARVGEDAPSLRQAVHAALDDGVDFLLVSGGAGGGDHDATGRVLEDAGFSTRVAGVGVRPGKPLWAGDNGRVVAFGLPGNPLSHFVCFHLFVRPAIARSLRRSRTNLLQLPIAANRGRWPSPNPRETWWPCQFDFSTMPPGVVPLPWRDSSDITSLTGIHGLIRVPPGGLENGQTAAILPASNLFP